MADAFWRRFEKLYNEPSEGALQTKLVRPLINVELGAGDVVVAGWIKVGTTWMQQLLHQLRTNGDESFTDIYNVTKYIPWHFEVLPSFDPDTPVQPQRPRIFKNHDCYAWRPKGKGVKYVSIIRDPLDTMWSTAKFEVRFFGGADEDLDASGLQRFLKSAMWRSAGTYHEWLLSWFPHREDDDVLWVHYEDLKEDLPRCVRKIAGFVGVPMTPALEKLVVERSSFDYMVANKEKFKGEDFLWRVMKRLTGEEWEPTMGMVWPDGGTVGQGAKEMSAEARTWFEDEWASTIGATLGFRDYAELRAQSSILREKMEDSSSQTS